MKVSHSATTHSLYRNAQTTLLYYPARIKSIVSLRHKPFLVYFQPNAFIAQNPILRQEKSMMFPVLCFLPSEIKVEGRMNRIKQDTRAKGKDSNG